MKILRKAHNGKVPQKTRETRKKKYKVHEPRIFRGIHELKEERIKKTLSGVSERKTLRRAYEGPCPSKLERYRMTRLQYR